MSDSEKERPEKNDPGGIAVGDSSRFTHLQKVEVVPPGKVLLPYYTCTDVELNDIEGASLSDFFFTCSASGLTGAVSLGATLASVEISTMKYPYIWPGLFFVLLAVGIICGIAWWKTRGKRAAAIARIRDTAGTSPE